MQFRKDSPYAVTFWCRYTAHVAQPLTWDSTLYIWDFLRSETVRKILTRENTLFATSRQHLGAVNIEWPWCCPC